MFLPYHAVLGGCWPPCSFPTCYVTACTAANTIATSTITSILRVRGTSVSWEATGLRLRYVIEFWASSAWQSLSDAHLGASPCPVTLKIGSSTAVCGNSQAAVGTVPQAHVPVGTAMVMVALQGLEINQLGLCVAEGASSGTRRLISLLTSPLVDQSSRSCCDRP